MHLSADMTIAAAIGAMQKEREALGTAIAVLQALVAKGVNPSTVVGGAGGVVVPISAGRRRRAPGSKPSLGTAAVAIVRAAGRPLHGLREIVPALETEGYKIKKSNRAGLATTLLRTGLLERVSPGTFGLKGGAATSAT